MHPPRCPYRGKASALRASTGVHNKHAIETPDVEALVLPHCLQVVSTHWQHSGELSTFFVTIKLDTTEL